MKENLIHSILIVASIPTLFSIFYLAARGISAYILHRKAKQNKIMQNTIKTQEIAALIEATKGKFFSITFVKKDGSLRTINAKDRFDYLIKGTGSPATDALREQGYMFAVNRNSKRFFSFKPEKVLLFKCGNVEKRFLDVVI
jgi:hypothetical protein